MAKFHRINQYIKAETVRLIDDKGGQLGVMPLKEALAKAVEAGLDLVEVAESATPPVVKLIEFSKFKYQESKKERSGSTKGSQETKEVRLSPFMAENDLQIKVGRVREILKAGDKVRLVVKFTGRQITKKEFGEKVMSIALGALVNDATIVEAPKMLGKLLIAQLKPKK